MICGRVYVGNKDLPIIQDAEGLVGDGCCKVGSLIEIEDPATSSYTYLIMDVSKDENTDRYKQ